MKEEKIRKKIREVEGVLEALEKMPPDRTLTKVKEQLRVRLETLRELLYDPK